MFSNDRYRPRSRTASWTGLGVSIRLGISGCLRPGDGGQPGKANHAGRNRDCRWSMTVDADTSEDLENGSEEQRALG